MKKLSLLFGLVLSFAFVQAQTLTNLEPFTKVLIKGNLKVELANADQSSIEIERGEDSRVEYKIEDGTLSVIHKELYKYKSYRDFPIKVKIAYQDLKKLDARAGARVSSVTSMSGIRLDIHLGSGAQLEADLQYEKVDVDLAEGSVAELSGRVGRFTSIASSGAQLEAYDLVSENSRIRANTGAEANISALKSLDAQANTGGSINYRGNPEEVVINVELWGNVDKH